MVIIGRRRELDERDILIERASGGTGGVVVVAGPSGSRRTALAEAAIDAVARDAYRKRLATLDAELDAADDAGDRDRATRGVVNVDQPLQLGAFAGLVRSLADQLRGPDFSSVWQTSYRSFRPELLPADAQDLVGSTSRPRQQVVLGYWMQLLDGRADEVTALVEHSLAALRTTGVTYLHIAGDEPAPGYRQWLSQRLPEATIEVWPRSGHFPHLAQPGRFAERLASTNQCGARGAHGA